MRHAVSYMFLFAILYIANYLLIPIYIPDKTSVAAAHFSSLESANHVRKRSAPFEDESFNHNFKQNNKVGKTKYYVSPAPVFQELVDNHDQTIPQTKGDVHGDIHYFYKIDMDTSPEPLQAISQLETPANVTHIGCFSTWMNQRSNFMDNDYKIYNESYTHLSCAEKCLQLDQYAQISFLKGAECRCGIILDFEAELVDKKYCNIPCPMKSYDPIAIRAHPVENPCGGNVGYSVYCTSGPEDCNLVFKKVNNTFTRKFEQTPTHISHAQQPWSALESCAVCTGQHCGRQHLYPDFDYFPVNSPQSCVEYCGSNVTWVHQTTGNQIRNSTPFALLLWWKASRNDMLPMCTCADNDVRNNFVHLSPHDNNACDMPCPGYPSFICGGRENNGSMYATIYCVGGIVNGKCNTSFSAEPPLPSTTTTSHPCDDPELDCDPLETEPPTTTEDTEKPTVSPTSSTTAAPITNNSSPTPPSETTPTPTTVSTSTTPTTSTTTPATTTPTPCSRQCNATDANGNQWNACASDTAYKNCSDLFPNYEGSASWICGTNGFFITRSPNISECSPKWLQDKLEEVYNVTNVDEANMFIQRLSAACKNIEHGTYQGHNIKDITGLIDMTMERVIYNFSASTNSLRPIVRNSVDLNAFLMQFHDPWHDLTTNEKSSLSTHLIENTEEILFHLTGSSEATQIVLHNGTGASKFLVFAETFNTRTNRTLPNNYEFPVSSFDGASDSYLKLPKGWQNVLPNDKVEIAAMSVDSEYISFIMPGQFENLKSASNVVNGDTKLINGRLISFTIKSAGTKVTGKTSRTQSVLFPGEGVKIIIQHDIEAWGDEIHDIPRKLHAGEKPKAVLGNTKCAFWDVQKLEWSSEGCTMVTNNRYETICECNHLTSFVVLMDIHKYVGKQLALEILTLILCPLSEIALLLSIIILSSINGIQKIRATITKNLCICLFVGNALVMVVLDKNYVNLSEGMCTASAIITHYVFLAAFMWMLIEGVQLYRMVVHVFDSGRSYIKHFGVFAYGFPMILVATTATIGYLKGDQPYGGDVFCWLEGPYIWSFLAPIAIIIMVNLIILFIALKTAYQVQQNKKLSPNFLIGRMRGYRTWFKGCFSLTVILGLTWVVGFFTLMKAPGGIVAAYIFTVLNASQGIFIFVYHCVFNDKVRSLTRRNLSTYLPSWLTSSVSSNPGANEASTYGKRPISSMKTGESALNNKNRKLSSNLINNPNEAKNAYMISNMKSQNQLTLGQEWIMKHPKQNFLSEKNGYVESTNPTVIPAQRCESVGTISSVDSIPNSSGSDSGHMSSDFSHKALISKNF